MINKILFTAVTLVCCQLVSAQTRDSLPTPGAKANTGPKPYASVITKNARTQVGLFTVHKVDERYYFELPDSILGRDVLVVSRLIKAAADMRSRGSMAGYAGDELNENVLRFEKGPNNKLFVRNLSYSERSADSSQALYKAVMNSNIQPITLVFDIKSIRKDSVSGITSSVIDLTDIINGDNDLFFFGPSKQAFKIGAYQADKSYVIDVKPFPINVEIKTLKTYTRAAQGMTLLNGIQSQVGPTGNFTVEINTSIVLLPKVPMQIRYADDRVGYFAKGYTDFDANPQRVKEQSFIERWKLEPKEADIEKYKSGELVEPKKQIVIYIDPATPAKWVPYLLQGINDWNGAFEKAGFKNAIVGRRAPTFQEDPSWSLEDARHSALVYKPSAVPNASGPQIADPRSGEIIETHINWYHNVMKLIHNWYFIQTAAVDAKARHMQFDDELMGQLIRFVSSHEVGHTLGLLHNFGSSSTTPVEKLRDNKWLTEHGHTPSIMDYARFNYVAQPEDSISQSNLFPRIGDYDKWAIEWGYRWIPEATTPEQELPILNKWIIEKLKDKRYWFGNERSPNDPRSQNEDIGDNAMKASEYGIKNLKRILPNLVQWTKTPDDGYGDLYEMYTELLSQFSRYIGHVTKNVGGRYETPKAVEQPGPVYEWVTAATQKEAVEFINKQVFTTPVWLVNNEVLSLVGISPLAIINNMQEMALGRLLDGYVLGNLQAASAMNPAAYNISQLFKDIDKGIWGELYSHQPISIYRRNLQKAYVEKMAGFVKPPSSSAAAFFSGTPQKSSGPTANAVSDVVSVTKASLAGLKSRIRAAIPFMKDEMTRYHLQDLAERITQALDVKGD
ncbi:DUF5117 domain-containing protein [Niastella caeni]|uniref:DUF5117 domain-containing protein n=1 Tax=Niastella caeni TaxID=2569763 RepID=A0A4V4H1E7_9BACT|nr:zinc-dependent metalloprotease [Niastella caeni]THU40156.1 DUF5117 domain-containing protein [Niastella caeni]